MGLQKYVHSLMDWLSVQNIPTIWMTMTVCDIAQRGEFAKWRNGIIAISMQHWIEVSG